MLINEWISKISHVICIIQQDRNEIEIQVTMWIKFEKLSAKRNKTDTKETKAAGFQLQMEPGGVHFGERKWTRADQGVGNNSTVMGTAFLVGEKGMNKGNAYTTV